MNFRRSFVFFWIVTSNRFCDLLIATEPFPTFFRFKNESLRILRKLGHQMMRIPGTFGELNDCKASNQDPKAVSSPSKKMHRVARF
ncbi:hypothetical protein [Leptospira stimsonii]|uniref:Uncharacterized protein n=1 Tax=Leptospira stimsonii TaxID=2202203 RepID=A0A8B6RYC0_9LEPT|nr:hypothetical protein [Leptospira stimsonii]RHX85939.1 hypothetical protein DLM78_08590 [Leptospira stimsonii]